MFYLPYFDQILEKLEQQPESEVAHAFRRHVHWGCFADPESADDSLAGYVAAANDLTTRVCDTAGVACGQRILDIGCGFGGTLVHLDSQLQGCTLVGLNIDHRQLERARALADPGDTNRLDFVTANACALPAAARSIDTMLAIECIFHFPSRKQFLREAARVLRPGGSLVITDFVLSSTGLSDYLAWLRGGEIAESDFYGRDQTSVTADAYERMARRCGLELCVDDDITAQTLPTYAAMRRLYADADLPEGKRATDFLEATARRGWVQYHVLRFRVPSV